MLTTQMGQQMEHCYFCQKNHGTLIVDPNFDILIHTECLVKNKIDQDPEAEKIAFLLGHVSKVGREMESNLIDKAQMLYYDPELTIKEAVKKGMIPKSELINGNVYVGFSRCGTKAIWDESQQCFHSFEKVYYKLGYFFKKCFNDGFIPIL